MSGTTVHHLVGAATCVSSAAVVWPAGGLFPRWDMTADPPKPTVFSWAPETYDECVTDINAKIHANVDAGLDLDPATPLGAFVAICAEKFQAFDALILAVYNGLDPSQASGNLLVQRAALSGTRPQTSTFSTVVGTLTLNASTTVHAGAVAAVDPGNTWILMADAVNDATSTQPVNAFFRASQPGPIDAFSGTLTQILTPAIGWTAITNASDAIKGLAADTDDSLRAKRERELQGEGTSNVDAIRARLLEVDHMVAVTIYQNTAPIGPDANGVPSKAFRVCYYDGPGALADLTLIAQTIFDNKPAGIQAFGSLTYQAVDSSGKRQDVGVDRAIEKPLYLMLTTTPAPNKTIGATERAAIRAALANYCASALNLGVDVIALPLRTAALGGVAAGLASDIPTFFLGFAPSPAGTVNLSISPLQIATLSTTNIEIDGTFA